MDWTRVLKAPRAQQEGKEAGIALFMVIAALTILSVLLTEFTYVAQVNAKMAYDGIDQVKAHYLAKGALKLSLLRLKAYQNLRGISSSSSGGSAGGSGGGQGGGNSLVPKQLLEKVWSFPLFFPIPTNIPGMSRSDKDRIDAFQKSSSLEGRFSALIESESSKYNLNTLLAQFIPPAKATPTPSPTPSNPAAADGAAPASPAAPPNATPSPTPFNSEEARKSLQEYIQQIFTVRSQSDDAFASEYRDFRVEDLVDQIAAWADASYERRTPNTANLPVKQAPFYSLSELHHLDLMDDELYNILSEHMTVSATPGLNVNTLTDKTLRALLPEMKEEEVKDFFEYRDSEEQDQKFKNEDDFFTYLHRNVAAFQGGEEALKSLKEKFSKRNLRIITEEDLFKITVQAQVNQATKRIDAWVTLVNPNDQKKAEDSAQSTEQDATAKRKNSSGLKITFMRIL